MKPYSPTANRAKYYAVRRWIRITTAASSCLIASMAVVHLPEYLFHKELKNQQKELQLIALKNGNLPIDTAAIQLAFTKCEKQQKKAASSVALLKKIKSLCKNDSNLELLSVKHHDLQITLAAKNASALVTIADTLTEQPAYSRLYISSLEPKEQRMIATLKTHQEIKNS